MEPFIAIGCLVLTAVLGIRLALYNIKVLRETKQQRLEARRAYKKAKNERLKRFLGL